MRDKVVPPVRHPRRRLRKEVGREMGYGGRSEGRKTGRWMRRVEGGGRGGEIPHPPR